MMKSVDDILFEICLMVIPAAAVFFVSFTLIKRFLENEAKRRTVEMRMNNQQLTTPIRLQAYERIVLFLERISPNSLVMRVHMNGMSAHLLHTELLKSIRTEFDHNLSQQIYLSASAWEMVKTAKDETTKLVNIAASKVKPDATGMELSQMIIQISGKLNKLPTQVAVDVIKKEINQLF